MNIVFLLQVADLKKELKIRNLSQVGKRGDLLERLQAAIASGIFSILWIYLYEKLSLEIEKFIW